MKIHNKKNDFIFVDTNIVFANFIQEFDRQKLEKNIELFEEIIKNNKKIKINNIVIAESYHVLFRRKYKKICQNLKIKDPGVILALKNEKIIGIVNALFNSIFEEVKKNINMDINFYDMTEMILKYKISSFDYLIANESKGNLITGDDDLKKYCNEVLIKK